MKQSRCPLIVMLPLWCLSQVACAQDKCAAFIFSDDRHMPPPPVYSQDQQAIFWVSPSAGPGSRVLVKGAFSPGIQQVEVAVVQKGTTDIASLFPGGGAQKAQVDSLSPEGFNFVIPQSLPASPGTVYALHILGTSLVAKINGPEVYWAMGMGKSLSPGNAAPGDSLKIMGLNFPLHGSLLLTDRGGQVTALPYSTDLGEQMSTLLPLGLPAGDYNLRVTIGSTNDALASNAISLHVAPASPPMVKTVSCPGLDPGGARDNASILNQFLKANAPSSGDLHLTLPAGTYLLTGPVTLQPHEYIDGAGPDQTILKGSSPQVPDIWIVGTGNFGLSSLGLSAPLKTALVGNFVNLYLFRQNLAKLGHISLDHLSLVCTPESPQQPKGMPACIQVGGPDIRITNVQTDNTQVAVAYNAIGFVLIPLSGGVVSGNHIILGNNGVGMYVYSYRGVLLEHNLVEGVTQDPGARGGISLPTTKATGSAGNIFVGRNVIRNIIFHDREGITTDIGGGTYFGPVASTSGASTVLAQSPNWGNDPIPPKAYRVTIIAGTGVGQFRDIVSFDGANLTLDRPWNPAPDQNSVVSVSLYQEHLQIAGNYFDHTGLAQFYGGIFESQINGNQMQDAMGVSLYSGVYFCAIQPLENIVIRGNIQTGDSKGDTERNFGIRISARDITAISGLLVTENQLPATGKILIADATMRMSPVLVEFHAEPLSIPSAHGRTHGIMLYGHPAQH